MSKNIRPNYYNANDVYEAIKVIQAWDLNFSLGSVLKYICRAGKKNGESAIKDLTKAKTYIELELDNLMKNEITEFNSDSESEVLPGIYVCEVCGKCICSCKKDDELNNSKMI